MNNLLTKKNILIVSVLGLISVVGLLFLTTILSSECAYWDGWSKVRPCIDIALTLTPLVALLPLSLIFFFIKEEIFHTWVRFAKWWILLSMFVILVSPEETGGWISLPIKGSIALVSFALLVVVSLILIAYKSYKLRGK